MYFWCLCHSSFSHQSSLSNPLKCTTSFYDVHSRFVSMRHFVFNFHYYINFGSSMDSGCTLLFMLLPHKPHKPHKRAFVCLLFFKGNEICVCLCFINRSCVQQLLYYHDSWRTNILIACEANSGRLRRYTHSHKSQVHERESLSKARAMHAQVNTHISSIDWAYFCRFVWEAVLNTLHFCRYKNVPGANKTHTRTPHASEWYNSWTTHIL